MTRRLQKAPSPATAAFREGAPSLGCIADDITGGIDLSGTLTQRGFRVIQTIGVPTSGLVLKGADAVVIALKVRNIPAPRARVMSSRALDRLKALGCRRFYFKYCSTFDSTPAGNIGPIIDKLLDGLREPFTVASTAFPAGGRTVYHGHLFVGNTLLSESGMRNHPITPMTDSNLVRVLQRQTRSRVGLIPLEAVENGAGDIRASIRRLTKAGVRIAIVDAVTDKHLVSIASAVSDLTLIAGSSGLARGFAPGRRPRGNPGFGAVPRGFRAIIAGSCSEATMRQLAHARLAYPAMRLKPQALQRNPTLAVRTLLSWAKSKVAHDRPIVIYSGGEPSLVAREQAGIGALRSGRLVETALGRVADGLVKLGVRQLIVAGGETSGSVMKALQVAALRIGPQICPGVNWATTMGNKTPIAVALKSGNFGDTEFMTEAWSLLDENGKRGT
ncbi:MAG TPA: 3-oxo-tetronate kinase [Opitutaceae bacterium]|jgi:uncharacterized protein YgbK (DUF1537 family)|nr:3-oxo-tetronate kinase [Opitutaceae bacterium]